VVRGIIDNLIPFVGRRARHKCDEWLIANIEHLVRNARLDINEVAGFVDHRLRQAVAKGVLDPALHDEQHHLETIVDMRIGYRAGRHGSNINREILRADILTGKTLLILNAIPAARATAAAQYGDTIQIFNLLGMNLTSTLRLGCRGHSCLREKSLSLGDAVWGERHPITLLQRSQMLDIKIDHRNRP